MTEKKTAYNLLVLLGPTASGKTKLAVSLADYLQGQIISADSRQVYRGLDIGSGKDLDEYKLSHLSIPYHLIDIVGLDQEYSLFNFQSDFYQSFQTVLKNKQCPLLVGGTGLYLEAALNKYKLLAVPEDAALRAKTELLSEAQLREWLLEIKPEQHNQTDLVGRSRIERAIEIALYSRSHQPEPAPKIVPLILGVLWENRSLLRARIAKRLKERLQAGLIEEVEALIKSGISYERLFGLGLEYRHVSAYLQKHYKNKAELYEKLYYGICDFAKRQLAWFRRMERKGHQIKWVTEGDYSEARAIVDQFEFDASII